MMHGQSAPVTPHLYPGVLFLVADQSEVRFDSIEYDDAFPRPIAGRSSDDQYYIKPNTDGTKHVLPHHAAVPAMAVDPCWNAPSQAHLDLVKSLIQSTSNVFSIEQDEWSRMKRFLYLHENDDLPEDAYKPDYSTTDMGWQQNWFHKTFGGPDNRDDWYFGANFRSGANGFDNYHYNRIFWMGIRLICEKDQKYRDEVLWPYFLEASMNHLCFGRFWSGPDRGAARDEKGTTYVGDSGRVPYSKQWILNLVMPYLLTDRHPAFEAMIRNCQDWWTKKQTNDTWKGYWGVRQAARDLEDNALIAIVMPESRSSMVTQVRSMLTQLDNLLDRDAWIWPNLGNGGQAEESPWMAVQAVSAIFRCWELLPETRIFGPSITDLEQVVKVCFSDYGSEQVGMYRVFRYRYHTRTDIARYIANTAWAVPALRFLSGHGSTWASVQLAETTELMQKYAGSSLAEVRNETPPNEDQIGFRFPPQGSAWSKTILAFLETVR